MSAPPRLREHYTAYGPAQMGPVELLSLVIGTASAGCSPRVIAAQLLDTFGSLEHLRAAPVAALACVRGVGPALAVRIHAALHLTVRAEHELDPPCLDHPEALVSFLRPRLQSETVETFWVVGLDTRLRVMGCQLISRGSRRCTIVDPSEVFRHAVAAHMSTLVLAHNHPSGDPSPSTEDKQLTRRLVQCGQMLGIPVVDHIVIGRHRHWSFQEQGMMPAAAASSSRPALARETRLRWSSPPHA